jgi:hypothetical protein
MRQPAGRVMLAGAQSQGAEQAVRPLARCAWPRADAERRDLDVLANGEAPKR